ncbi:hypothetical protein BVRB_7g177940 isoform B [Beta vulgaris subsp. vulgaris]|nr:hypothetical protein BVRB_7g177940 isoform B [Beta vulgaris subsp. vulgaris]
MQSTGLRGQNISCHLSQNPTSLGPTAFLWSLCAVRLVAH